MHIGGIMNEWAIMPDVLWGCIKSNCAVIGQYE